MERTNLDLQRLSFTTMIIKIIQIHSAMEILIKTSTGSGTSIDSMGKLIKVEHIKDLIFHLDKEIKYLEAF